MKDITDWDEDYIKQLPGGEFDWLEFKGRKGLDFSVPGIVESKVLENLSVQLSAMANSGGGTIVFGFTDPSDLSERQVDDGGIILNLKGRNTKEWLEDVIPNLVEGALRRFSVVALTKDKGAPNVLPGRCIILIHVGDSRDAPHQARDSRYYVRIGGKSRPAGHRIVSDIFNRGTTAEFDVGIFIGAQLEEGNRMLSPFPQPAERVVRMAVSAKNVGSVLAKYVKIQILIPFLWASRDDRSVAEPVIVDGIKYFELEEGNSRRDVVGHNGYTAKYGSSWFDPILPGLSHEWHFVLNSKLTRKDLRSAKVLYSIYADSAPESDGIIDAETIDFQDDEE